MQKFALLRLENGSNKVIADVYGNFEQALKSFNEISSHKLDNNGYCKVNETVSLCIAEYHQNFTEL